MVGRFFVFSWMAFVGFGMPAVIAAESNQDTSGGSSLFGYPIKQWHLHLNGYSIHFHTDPDDPPNDWLLGLGAAAELETPGKWIWEIVGDVFLDSSKDVSAVLGPTVRWPFNDHVSAGAGAFLMYKKTFQRDYNFPVLPVPLPFVDLGGERMALRTYYIPPVRRPQDHQVVFQVRIAL